MQSKQTIRLAVKIRKIHEKKIKGKKTPFRVVCERLNIRKEDGRTDEGLAYKIGYNDYEPSSREVRKRLGLRDVCSKCKRAFRVIKPAVVHTPSPALAWWKKLKREEREKVINASYKNYLNWRNKWKTIGQSSN